MRTIFQNISILHKIEMFKNITQHHANNSTKKERIIVTSAITNAITIKTLKQVQIKASVSTVFI